jgi:hypothetical protein
LTEFSASELIKRLLGELKLSPKGDTYSLMFCAFALFSKNVCPLFSDGFLKLVLMK